MKKRIAACSMIFIACQLNAQTTEIPVGTVVEQQLENISGSNDDTETEDDSYIQELAEYARYPLDLNNANETKLSIFPQLNAVQIAALISYRGQLGKLISIYELQAVPGWDLETIQQLRPYVFVGTSTNLSGSIRQRFTGGVHSMLLRVSQILERSKGFLVDHVSGNSFYAGSPQKIFFRYGYNYRSIFEYGLTAEKDAGEQFFRGRQRYGFDFYSAHFFIRDAGVIKALGLGDFTVSMGQGLTQWMGTAFGKTTDIAGIKRQGAILKPYSGSGEINFHRGVGITLQRGRWQTTAFGSFKKIDANMVPVDSLNEGESVSALQTSGLHRSMAELADKSSEEQLSFGGNLCYNQHNFHVGLNTVYYRFSAPVFKRAEPYNLYAIHGRNLANYSSDYSYTYKNMHLFGEAAISENGRTAFVNGMIIAVSGNADMSFLYRNIAPGYQSLYSAAFTENTVPTNEKGFFSGLSFKPVADLKVDVYCDLFSFPWLKYRINAPSDGRDYLVQFTWKPNKLLEIYSKFRAKTKYGNAADNGFEITGIESQKSRYWRTQVSYKIDGAITIRNRVEVSWINKNLQKPEAGWLFYTDILYRPLLKPFSVGTRLQYFETGSYASRIYAFENDVLYSFSIPPYYGKGYMYYINLHGDVGKKVDFWVHYGRTIYLNEKVIGSGLDEINGFHKTVLKMQLFYTF